MRRVLLSAFLMVVALSACSADTPVADGTPELTPAPSLATPEASASATPSAEPVENPAPPELLGRWEAEIVPRTGGFAPTATLTLTEGDYHIVRDPDISSGDVAVVGDEITFSEGSVCSVTGTYTWALEDDVLTFTVVSDSCPGRIAMLDGQTYRR